MRTTQHVRLSRALRTVTGYRGLFLSLSQENMRLSPHLPLSRSSRSFPSLFCLTRLETPSNRLRLPDGSLRPHSTHCQSPHSPPFTTILLLCSNLLAAHDLKLFSVELYCSVRSADLLPPTHHSHTRRTSYTRQISLTFNLCHLLVTALRLTNAEPILITTPRPFHSIWPHKILSSMPSRVPVLLRGDVSTTFPSLSMHQCWHPSILIGESP